jgi:hypothetical protein
VVDVILLTTEPFALVLSLNPGPNMMFLGPIEDMASISNVILQYKQRKQIYVGFVISDYLVIFN